MHNQKHKGVTFLVGFRKGFGEEYFGCYSIDGKRAELPDVYPTADEAEFAARELAIEIIDSGVR